ncbi:MAG: MerR family transcriptional regulator [Huintestinicola sp.]|uniref:MerR family transcriptional regulator n=1 Tax=Huintestinicola sp. TaxID=2981661 RepID=UPI003F03089D
MYSIGVFSKLTRTTVAALRFYDREGIFKPAYTDEKTGYRYYLSSQLSELQEIISLRQTGMSVEQIKEISVCTDKGRYLSEYHKQLENKLSEMQRQLKKLELMQSGQDSYKAAVKDIPECKVFFRTASVESNKKLYDFISDTEREFFTRYSGLKTAVPDYCFLTYLDNEYRCENMTVEYSMAVAPCEREADGIEFKYLKGCRAACLYFNGSNKYIGAAFAYLYDWINKSGYIPCGAPRERYIDGMWNVDSVDRWLTEIQIPIE